MNPRTPKSQHQVSPARCIKRLSRNACPNNRGRLQFKRKHFSSRIRTIGLVRTCGKGQRGLCHLCQQALQAASWMLWCSVLRHCLGCPQFLLECLQLRPGYSTFTPDSSSWTQIKQKMAQAPGPLPSKSQMEF